MTLSTDERRALGIIAGLLVAASAARWLERPKPLLEDVPAMDVASLEASSRDAKPEPKRTAGSGGKPDSKPRATTNAGRAGAFPGALPPASARSRNAPRSASTTGAARTDTLIDPNTATAEELDALPGVGPSLAARIIEERARGPYRTAGDLTRVRGIGATLANTLAGRVSLPAGPVQSDASRAGGLTPVANAPAMVTGTAPRGPPDINYISSTDLQKVRGVGPALAAKLIARRDSLRRFTTWEQVDSVAGVGPAMLSRLKETLVLRR